MASIAGHSKDDIRYDAYLAYPVSRCGTLGAGVLPKNLVGVLSARNLEASGRAIRALEGVAMDLRELRAHLLPLCKGSAWRRFNLGRWEARLLGSWSRPDLTGEGYESWVYKVPS